MEYMEQTKSAWRELWERGCEGSDLEIDLVPEKYLPLLSASGAMSAAVSADREKCLPQLPAIPSRISPPGA